MSSFICDDEPVACQVFGQYIAAASRSFVEVAPNAFRAQYGDGSAVVGDYINETLAIGNTVITDITMGLAQDAHRPLGIMGIGYDENESIAAQDPDLVYPNVVSQLEAQGEISTSAYSLWLNDLCMLPCP